MRAQIIGDIFGILFSKERFFISQDLVQRLACERQNRRKEDLQRIDRPDGGVNGFPGTFFIFLDLKPGRFFIQVLIDFPGQAHGFCQGCPQFDFVVKISDFLKTIFDQSSKSLHLLGAESPGSGTIPIPIFMSEG